MIKPKILQFAPNHQKTKANKTKKDDSTWNWFTFPQIASSCIYKPKRLRISIRNVLTSKDRKEWNKIMKLISVPTIKVNKSRTRGNKDFTSYINKNLT